ncbi:MAG: UDP-2-acetamido-2-deoxy-3-oxo-D-glucuronate aminotransferase [Verrucomicrobiota bacterium]|jgi:UDP-2-acetamido-2-deoxy-ribo-hexuluronate aminotransferase
MEFIDLQEQYRRYQAEIDGRMQRVLQHGRFIMGPEVLELEETLARYVGVKHCLSVGSGTVSLEMALRALGVGPGDEVITPPFTFIATAEVALLVGAKPVFVDIEPEFYNLDPAKLEAAITPRTKAIIPVDLFGQLADYGMIHEIACGHNLPVIEDAAQSFGAEQGGRKSCSFGLIASTSFFPAKPLGCYGEGGALFTNDDALADKMRAIRNHGGVVRDQHETVGLNGRFDSLQAAVLLAKLPHFDWELEQRARIGARYSEALRDVCGTPAIRPGNTHVYAQYTLRMPDRDAVMAALREQGIPSAVYYSRCLHLQGMFAELGYKAGDFPVAEQASREVLSLPMHPFLTEEEQDRVVRAVREALGPG